MRTRPEPTFFWQLRKLELHCRQKVPGSQSQKSARHVVASPQQSTYTQLINNLVRITSGQLVGDLWTACGPQVSISHDGLLTLSYIHNWGLQPRILTKIEIIAIKLAVAYLLSIPKVSPQIYFSAPKKQPQARLGRGVVGVPWTVNAPGGSQRIGSTRRGERADSAVYSCPVCR